MMRLGFSGKMRSGKDTAADYMTEKLGSFGYNIQRLSFAGTLKRIGSYIQQECGFPVERDRELYQWLGTDYGRKRNPNVWTDALERQITTLEAEGDVDAILVTDVRFPNEVEMLHRRGFTLVRVSANPALRLFRGADPDCLEHLSEVALDELDRREAFDWMIQNEGSLDDFKRVLDAVIAREFLEGITE